jgi:hypothetical protein
MAEETSQETGPVAAQAIEVLGDATPEQVAALVAVLSAASGAAGAAATQAAPRHTSPWSAPARLVRRAPAPGPGAWRQSLRP